jgi:hypothetical protein
MGRTTIEWQTIFHFVSRETPSAQDIEAFWSKTLVTVPVNIRGGLV